MSWLRYCQACKIGEVSFAPFFSLSSSATTRPANEKLRSAIASICRFARDCDSRKPQQWGVRGTKAALSRKSADARRLRTRPIPSADAQKTDGETQVAKEGEDFAGYETPGGPGRGGRDPFPQHQVHRLFAGEQRTALPQNRDSHDDPFVSASCFRSDASSGAHCFVMKYPSAIQCVGMQRGALRCKRIRGQRKMANSRRESRQLRFKCLDASRLWDAALQLRRSGQNPSY
jgi:hypothetical protein